MAYVPVPWQMLLAAIAAAVIGCNLPIAVALVWISNPITMPPMFYAAYKLGAWVLSIEPRALKFELSFDWLLGELGAVWQPFLLGCFLTGLTLAIVGHIAVRVIWRLHVIYSWRERQIARRSRTNAGLEPGTPAQKPKQQPVEEDEPG
jgi:uncharacterized protein (DUF2062 family)